ncbi:hypothetical protein [Roseibacillus persicicus]
MSGAEKLRAGAELFEEACAMSLRGIRFHHPEWTDEQCRRELTRRVLLQ